MPTFRFLANGAVEQVVQSRVGTIRPQRRPSGSRVTVLYDTANPSLAEIAGARIWLGPVGCLVLAAGSLLAAWKAGG